MSKIQRNDHSSGPAAVTSVRDLTSSEQTEFDAFTARLSGDNDPRKKLADDVAKKETDRAAGIEKLKGLGLTADEAAAVSG